MATTLHKRDDWDDELFARPSDTQTECLRALNEHGTLWRTERCHWTSREQCEGRPIDEKSGDPPPDWFYRTRTVRGLVRRGFAEVDHNRTHVKITSYGKQFLHDHDHDE